jgi:hypothetical protein
VIAVGICALGASGDEEARALAADLGGVAYEWRLKLAQPTPLVVLRTNDKSAAADAVRKLRARGHDTVAIDEDAVPEPAPVRSFRLGDAAFERDDTTQTQTIAYGDVLALVRAGLTLRTEKIDKVTERKLRVGATLATGGIPMMKKVTREEKHVTHDREELLYVYPASGTSPWLVTEHGTVYTGLPEVALTQHENFARVVAELRARATAATYDERLLGVRHESDRRALDLRAQMIAISVARRLTYR